MANMNWTSDHTRLRTTLASIYVDKDSTQRIIDEAGIDPTSLKFSDIAANNWYNIIREADAQGVLIQLVELASNEYKTNKTLKELLEVFRARAGTLGQLVRPGEKEVQEGEIECINPPRVQKEGGYIIDEPPADWIIEELTLYELISRRLGVKLGESSAASTFSGQFAVDLYKRYILWIRSQSQLKIEQDPGTTLINGRQALNIITETIPVALLTIMPVERNSIPPFFVRQSFEHTFVANMNQFLQIYNLRSFFASTTKNTNWLRLTAEFDQRVENVIVDGMPRQSFTVNQTVIGIQGLARDFFLMLGYVSQATSNKAEIESQVALLQSLVDSFKLIKPANLDEEEQRSHKEGDQRYHDYVEQNATKILASQFILLMEQWRELDWKKKESKQRVLQDAKRFKKAAEVFTGDGRKAVKILLNQFNVLMDQWRELDWKKKESKQRVLQDKKRFEKAIEAFNSDDELLVRLKEFLHEFEQMSLADMNTLFTSKD